MTPSPVYVPIVKGKKNDLVATGRLAPAIRRIVKPLVEAMPVNREKDTTEEHLHRLCSYIRKHVPLGSLFVDFWGLDQEETLTDGTNVVLQGYGLLKAFDRPVTPIFGFERNDALWDGLAGFVRHFGNGFCFRLGRDEVADYAIEDTWDAIIARSAQLGVAPADIDLLVDFKAVSTGEVDRLVSVASGFFCHNPRRSEYRSLIVAGSSALRDVGEVERDGDAEVVRDELTVWSRLWRDMPDDLKPVFADYGVVHPDFTDSGPNRNINAKIRYTTGRSIRYFRGHGLWKPVKDYEQYHALAARVRNSGYFAGREASHGDAYIADCASHLVRHGAPGTWVQVDMNHHMTHTADQLARAIPALVTARSDVEAEQALERA